MPRRGSVVLAVVVMLLLAAAPAVAGENTAPATPTITEPAVEGQIVHPADVHMETSPFSDPNSADSHACTDWEIRLSSSTGEIVWSAPCSPELVHVHLADGTFVNSYAGRTELEFATSYALRARHKDNSGDAATEWSTWAARSFRTASQPPPGTTTTWSLNQPGFDVERVATGFQLPVNIAFIPNAGASPSSPFFYVTELYGTIKVVTRDGTVSDYIRGALNYQPNGKFPGSGEQGLTGIVVDPGSGDVFASMLYESSPGGPHYPKVVRFHSNHSGSVAGSHQTILDMPGETQGQSHQISNLTIGPDGKLYVHMGDGFETARAQDLSSHRGKILRVNLDGSTPTDNPFYDAADGITARDRVFAYGFRNPFGGAWRAADGQHYEVENGPAVDRFAKVVAGRNYKWDGTNDSMRNFALYNWTSAVAPVNLAFIEPATFGGSGFPASKMGHAFVSESGPTYAAGVPPNGKRITEFALDSSGARVSGPVSLLSYTGTGKATVAGLASGPDGLYFTDLYKDSGTAATDVGANVYRIRWTGAGPSSNLLRNADFETDANGDRRPDKWTTDARFTRRSAVIFSGEFAGRHRATDNSSYLIRQKVPGVLGGATYSFSGHVNIPQTTDALVFRLQVRWLDGRDSAVGTHTVQSFTGPTEGWEEAAISVTAPATATHAHIRMVVKGLNATVHVDQFKFGS